MLDSTASGRATFGAPAPIEIRLANETSCQSRSYEPAERVNLDSASGDLLKRLDSIVAEVGLVRDSFVTRDGDGRVDVNAAPFQVLAILPGLGASGARAIIAARRWRRRLETPSDLLAVLPPEARDSAIARWDKLQRTVTFNPSSLILAAIGRDSRAPPLSTEEVLIVPVGNRVAVVRRRLW